MSKQYLAATKHGRRRDSGSEIRIILNEAAVGKPRMTRRDKWARRPAVEKYREWCDRLRATAGKLPSCSHIQSLSWKAYFSPPKSWTKKRKKSVIGCLHQARPDRDNIDKAILDCLFPDDDSGISSGTIEKWWDTSPRLEITIVLQPGS